MLRKIIIPLLASLVITSYSSANDPLRPDANGVVEAIFNPDLNYAAYGRWLSSKMGGGGYMLNVVMNDYDPDILYAHSDVGGIFRSDDNGRNWYMVHNTVSPQSLDCVRDLLVDPNDPDKLIAAVGTRWAPKQGIYVSDDGGQSWTKTLDCQVFGNGSNRSAGRILQRSPIDDDTIYVAPGIEGIFMSTDGGSTWQRRDVNLDMGMHYVTDLKIDRTNANRIFLCAETRTMSSISSWTSSRTYYSLTGGLFRSDDGGQTWTTLDSSAPLEMLQSPVDAARWYAIRDCRRIEYSDDYGATWTDDSTGLSLTSDPSPPPQWDTSYKSLAAGPDFLVVGSGSGTFYIKQPLSSDWAPITNVGRYQGDWYAKTVEGEWDHFGRATASVVVDPNDPDHWFFTDWYSVHQTWDAGANWTLTIDGIENTVIHDVAGVPSDPATVHMGMADNGYYQSINGADSFPTRAGSTSNCKAVAVAPSDPNTVYILGNHNWYVGWYSNTVYASTNGGLSLYRQDMTNVPKDPDTVGSAINQWLVNSIAVDSSDSEKIYITVSGAVAQDEGGVWASTDAGDTWTWDSAGLPSASSFFQSSIWDTGHQLARNFNGSMVAATSGSIYYRDSDNDNWAKASITRNGGSFNQVYASATESGVYYLGESYYGVHRSDDNGATWTRVLDQGVQSLAVDPNQDRIAAALDEAGGILLSDDGGSTWTAVDNNIPQRYRLKMAFAGDRLVVGTPGNGTFYLPLTIESLEIRHPANDDGVYTTGQIAILEADYYELFDVPASLQWSVLDNPSGIQIDDPTAQRTSVRFTEEGRYSILLTATSTDGLITTRVVNLTVLDTQPTGNYAEFGGEISIEAENFSDSADGSGDFSGHYWTFSDQQAGYTGTGAMTSDVNIGNNSGDTTDGPRLDYDVYFSTPGTYYVWARLYGDSNVDDSVHFGLDGSPVTYGRYGVGSVVDGAWSWSSKVWTSLSAITIPSAGTYTINVWMREDGVWFDKLYLTQSTTTPTGEGTAAYDALANTPPEPSIDIPGYAEFGGSVAIEAENYTVSAAGSGDFSGSYWTFSDQQAGYTGTGAMTSDANTGRNTGDTIVGPRLDYDVYFSTPGTYYVWARLYGDSNVDDSVHFGLDGSPVTYGRYGVGSVVDGAWSWSSKVWTSLSAITIPSAGTYTINVWMREDGVWFDKLYLTQSTTTPTGEGAPDLGIEYDSGTATADVQVSAAVALNGSATDDGIPGTQSLTYTWEVVSGPGSVVFTNAETANASVELDTAGSYVIRLCVSDGELESAKEVTLEASN
ncbi:PKD domain-containing protein [Coraliomargarita parva]|uniref:PKD domain-containing protein n=1 Tax=Coraliomargarita parva TaxID=3014050 RepID=UPI0022B40239|nr:hypothetical protein [Coraliomargarita parva]